MRASVFLGCCHGDFVRRCLVAMGCPVRRRMGSGEDICQWTFAEASKWHSAIALSLFLQVTQLQVAQEVKKKEIF